MTVCTADMLHISKAAAGWAWPGGVAVEEIHEIDEGKLLLFRLIDGLEARCASIQASWRAALCQVQSHKAVLTADTHGQTCW